MYQPRKDTIQLNEYHLSGLELSRNIWKEGIKRETNLSLIGRTVSDMDQSPQELNESSGKTHATEEVSKSSDSSPAGESYLKQAIRKAGPKHPNSSADNATDNTYIVTKKGIKGAEYLTQ